MLPKKFINIKGYKWIILPVILFVLLSGIFLKQLTQPRGIDVEGPGRDNVVLLAAIQDENPFVLPMQEPDPGEGVPLKVELPDLIYSKTQPTIEVKDMRASGELDLEPVPNQVLIQFEPDSSEVDRTAYVDSLGGKVLNNIEQINTLVVELPDGTDEESLPESSVVMASEQNTRFHVAGWLTPNDPDYGYQWGPPYIGAPDAWADLPPSPTQVTVAVLDTGMCGGHPDMAGRYVAGWDFVENDAVPQDEQGHGCAVASIIAANMNDSIGMAGVAPNAMIMPLRVLDANGSGNTGWLIDALIYAADHGAQIANMSLSYDPYINPGSALYSAVTYANSKGLIMVAAAGNDSTDYVCYPARYDEIIAVGSIDSNGQRSSFSNYGPQIEALAPGGSIYMANYNGGYYYGYGTSMAAPHVSAAIAVVDFALVGNLTLDGSIIDMSEGQPPAPNDDFDSATVISSIPYSDVGDVLGATLDSDDPYFTQCYAGKGDKTVWYKYIPGSSGWVRVNTTGSSYDTMVAVWTGTRGNLFSLACNDDDVGGQQSDLVWYLEAGTTYYIEVAQWTSSSSSSSYISQEINKESSFSESSIYTLNLNVEPVSGGIITGSVIEEADGVTSIPYAEISVYPYEGGAYEAFGYANTNGDYAFLVDEGNYAVHGYKYAYTSEYYDEGLGSLFVPTSVAVSSTGITSGIDFYLEPGGSIRGYVKKQSDGTGIYSVPVVVETDSWSRGICTSSSGYYQLDGLPQGESYRVQAAPSWASWCSSTVPYVNEYWQEKRTWSDADPITLTASPIIVENINFTLEQGGAISGQVENSSGTAIENANVVVLDTDLDYITNVYTDSSGDFNVVLPAGQVYLEIWADNNITEYYDNAYFFDDADLVTVSLGTTTTLANDIVLESGAAISGRVTDENGSAGLPYAWIQFFANDNTYTYLFGVGTDADGYYTRQVPAGSYKIKAWPDGGVGYAPEFYDGDDGDYFIENALAVTAGTSGTIGGINFSLAVSPDPITPNGDISTGDPTFVWAENYGFTWYDVQVKNSSGDVVASKGAYVDSGISCSNGVCSYDPGFDLYGGDHTWQVRAWVSDVGYTAWSAEESFHVDLPPYESTPQSPSGTIYNSDPTFEWSEAYKATYYSIQVKNSGGTVVSSKSAYVGSGITCSGGTCSWQPGMSLMGGDYTWEVRPWCVSLGYGPWSSGMAFTVDLPPYEGTPVSPTDSIDNGKPTFVWDEAYLATFYTLQVKNSGGTVVSSKSAYVGSGITCSGGTCSWQPGMSLLGGDYIWEVRPWCSSLGYGPWSSGMAFTVDLPPYDGTPVSPSGSIDNGNPTFVWDEAYMATYYALQVKNSGGTVVSSKSGYVGSSITCTAGTCSWQPGMSLLGGDYTWEVKPWCPELGYGPWSSGLAFNVDLPPYEGTPQTPSGYIDNGNPTFVWDEAYLATYYSLQVKNAGGTVVTSKSGYVGSSITCSGGTCSWQPGMSLLGGDYTWEVKPWCPELGYGPWSSGMAFNVDLPPYEGTPVSPTGSIDNGNPTFVWDEAYMATYYSLQVKNAGGTVVSSKSGYVGNSITCTGGTCSWQPGMSLLGGDYTWEVKPWCSELGYGTWSSGMGFTVDLPPYEGTPVSPTGSIDNGNPTFVWDEAYLATYYSLQVKNAGGTVVSSKSGYVGSSITCSGGTCSWQPGMSLLGGDYTWAVKPWCPELGYGAWSNGKAFTVSLPPFESTPIAPNGTISTSNPTFEWSEAGGATYYSLVVKNTGGSVVASKAAYVGEGITCSGGTCTWQPGFALADMAYTWQIKPWAPSPGYGPWSAEQAFEVLTHP